MSTQDGVSGIVVCVDCGRQAPHAGHGRCRGCAKREWRRDPDHAERDREASRRWKAQNQERTTAYDRDYNQAHRGVCSHCGGAMCRRHDDGVCPDCRRERRDERYRQIARLYAAGVAVKQIAAELEMSFAGIATTIHRMRADGWDLPYRHPVRSKAAA